MRFTSKDHMSNIRYLVVTPARIYLTNPNRAPLSLTNVTDDAALLTFRIEDILESDATDGQKAEAIITVLRTSTGYSWSLLTWSPAL